MNGGVLVKYLSPRTVKIYVANICPLSLPVLLKKKKLHTQFGKAGRAVTGGKSCNDRFEEVAVKSVPPMSRLIRSGRGGSNH